MLFSPIKIGNCEIPNRLVVPAMVTNYCTADGILTDRYIGYMTEKAKGGFGLLITEDYAVCPEGKGYERIPGLYTDEQIEKNLLLTDSVHKYGSRIFCQLYHPGRQTGPWANGGADVVAPSAIKDPAEQVLPRAITTDEIKRLITQFGEAASRAKAAGFDGIEIHAGHGYLIAEFLSPYYNKRTDEYGGCFQNRVRLLDEIYQAVRKETGSEFPITIRYSGIEYLPGGRTKADSLQLAVHAEKLGFDAQHISNGSYSSDPRHAIIATMHTEHAINMDIAEEIKKLVQSPVIVTNRINDPEMADSILIAGKADMIGMGRGSICDPYLPSKAQEGRFDEIRYCIGCHLGCFSPLFMGGSVTCVVNPEVGREFENNLQPASDKKKIMVIGGGPAGLEAAYIAAKRGHQVELFEKADSLGGQFRAAACPVEKGELSTLISSLRAQLSHKQVKVHLNTEVTEEIITDFAPDTVILATGAAPLLPQISGIDGSNVCTAEDVLLGRHDIGYGPVVVCGGGEVGGETANFIAQVNHNVTMLEMQPDILNDMSFVPKMILLEMLQKNGVRCITDAKVSCITNEAITYETSDKKQEAIPAETVVAAFGYRSENCLKEAAEKHCNEVIVIGGAIKPGNALIAMKDGYEAGIKL